MRCSNAVPCQRAIEKYGVCRTEYSLEAIRKYQLEAIRTDEGDCLEIGIRQIQCKRHDNRKNSCQGGHSIPRQRP